MNENSVVSLRQKDDIDDPLTEILRTGAHQSISRAVEVEFDTFLASNCGCSAEIASENRVGVSEVMTNRSHPGIGKTRGGQSAKANAKF